MKSSISMPGLPRKIMTPVSLLLAVALVVLPARGGAFAGEPAPTGAFSSSPGARAAAGTGRPVPGPPPKPRSGRAGRAPGETGAEEAPLELLEFLGEWETEDGRWIDPAELEEMELPHKDDAKNDA